MDPLSLNDLIRLDGKGAIVTGAAKGIGYGIGYRLAEAGAGVLIADVDREAAEEAAAGLAAKGWRTVAAGVDVSDEQQVRAMVGDCRSAFGSVDILVNNAGIYPNQPLAQMRLADFQRVLDVNLTALFLTTKHASEAMKAQGNGGRIVNVTSIDAIHPSMVGFAHYDASKHGAWGFTKNSALELAEHGIWVNAIAPGGIATPGVEELQRASGGQVEPGELVRAFLAKIPMHRLGHPDEVGRAALFLASELSAYMTGSQVVVDGGALLS